ncbi:hypothetical protein [uncultured Sulfitobacter sp.]|uniref:protein-tyrosine phosphatase family protein n=1 Tax=uncultured Sulfitobacter sp. TaxID=191468 RepID=UPI0026392671|nr:hypothetical protein [uncultured Sulfitobacter sp.]
MTRPQVLPDDIALLPASGIDIVVSMLEPAEAAEIGLATQANACASLGLTYLTHPIRDMHLPDPAPFAAFANNIAERLRGGAHIAVHCYASIGRSGLLACTVLGHFGYSSHTALAHVSKMRDQPVPDTTAQTDFLHQTMVTPSA